MVIFCFTFFACYRRLCVLCNWPACICPFFVGIEVNKADVNVWDSLFVDFLEIRLSVIVVLDIVFFIVIVVVGSVVVFLVVVVGCVVVVVVRVVVSGMYTKK